MKNKLREALNEISDAKIAEAGNAKRKLPIRWVGAVAAVLAVAVLGTALLPGIRSSDTSAPTLVPAGPELLAAPEYPQMAPYPDESAYISPLTGEFDGEGFDQVYTAWREDIKRQRNQPKGYADGLEHYFLASIPEFLAAGEGENAVCSPLNVYMALSMLAETSGGGSRQEILDLLEADSIESLRAQAESLWNAHYCDDGASTSVLANSLWLDSGLTYDTATVETLADSYYASVYQGELGTEAMNQMLRDWINSQTGGLLEEQVQALELPENTVLALASTIYFRAKWNSEFTESRNTLDTFHAPAGDVTATFMHQTMAYGPYYWGDDFGAVYRGLQDGSLMWLILPDEGLTPEDILESGNALKMILGNWQEYENQKSLKVNLSMPKFDVSGDMELSDALKNLGITEVFEAGNANFSPILPEVETFLDTVQHAARVKVDEEGVEAAAYTVMTNATSAMPPEDEMDFILDRPFLFVITSRDGLPLFAGMVNVP